MSPIDPTAISVIEDLYRAALDEVNPSRSVALAIKRNDNSLTVGDMSFDVPRAIHIVAIGKAAVPMTLGATEALGSDVASTFVLTKHGHVSNADALAGDVHVYEAGHPVPDLDTVAGTRALLDHVATFDRDDLVVFLISGGGSAICEAPVEGVSLEDFAAVTRLLLQAGAPIQDLNAVRSQLSRVKGGGLRQATPVRKAITIMLSDVLGNDPQIIASGPTVVSSGSREQAIEVLEKYGLEHAIPASVQNELDRCDQEHLSSNVFQNDVAVVIADNNKAVDAVLDRARALGIPARAIWREQEGEASYLGREWVSAIESHLDDPLLLVGGGEATVSVRGNGLGGRNSEFVVAAAEEMYLKGIEGWTVSSLATDGQDALTDAAGGIANGAIAQAADMVGDSAAESLTDNDSFSWLQRWGHIVAPGPTGTNVNDLYFALPDKLAPGYGDNEQD